jgi:hypothetical protein
MRCENVIEFMKNVKTHSLRHCANHGPSLGGWHQFYEICLTQNKGENGVEWE